jgi:hypothetical protein
LDDIFKILFQNKAKKLQKLFSHQFSQNIWRILSDPDPDSDLWAIELRDAKQKKVSFALVDLSVPELKWHTAPEGTDWWISLTSFSDGRLFLHNYRHTDVPEPTDLYMVAAENGETQWVLPNHLLVKRLNMTEIEVAVKTGEGFRYGRCNAETGIIVTYDDNIEQEQDEIILGEPVRYREGNKYFDRLAAFIVEHTGGGHKPICIDYLEKRPYLMFSYYIYEQEKMAEYLLIVTSGAELLLHERLSDNREGIGQSTMLLKGSKLVYLKNNNEFSSLTFY